MSSAYATPAGSFTSTIASRTAIVPAAERSAANGITTTIRQLGTALGPLAAPGALMVGDAAGFVNEARLKGLHYAMRSGMLAAEAIRKATLISM